MANWHMKRCLTLLISREMQAKITMRYHLSSVAQSCLTLCDPMRCSTPGFPVHHQLLELAQTHVHRAGDASTVSSSVVPFTTSHQSQWPSLRNLQMGPSWWSSGSKSAFQCRARRFVVG